MAITDLTNTKWLLNENLINGLSLNEFSYVINFTSYDLNFTELRWRDPAADYDNINTYELAYQGNTYERVYMRWDGSNWSWANEFYRTLEITGGTDATNTNLISWLEQNATQIKDTITQLAPFLTNIANAIRTKKGTTDKINAQNFASEIESIESGGLVGYSGTITFTGLTNYNNISYFVIHSDGTYENITSVSGTNNVSNAIYIGVDANNRYALASTRQTNTDRIFGIEQTYSFYQITGDNWVVEFYEDL